MTKVMKHKNTEPKGQSNKQQLLSLYRQMLTIRLVEERLALLSPTTEGVLSE